MWAARHWEINQKNQKKKKVKKRKEKKKKIKKKDEEGNEEERDDEEDDEEEGDDKEVGWFCATYQTKCDYSIQSYLRTTDQFLWNKKS